MSAEKSSNEQGRVPFEDVLNKAGFGMYSYLMTTLTGLVIISFTCCVYGTMFIIPASACELNTSVAQQGVLAAMPVLGLIIGAVLWGYLGDTRGRRNMLFVSLLLAGSLNAVASLSVNWIMLMILQFLAAFIASGKYTLSMTLLSESVPMAKRNHVVLLVTSIFLLSQGIMAVLAIPIIPQSFSYHLPSIGIYWNSWRTLMLVYSVPSFVCALWLCFMKESPKFIYAKGDDERALEILSFIHKMNNCNSKEEFQVKGFTRDVEKEESLQKAEISQLFKMPLLKYTIIMTTLAMLQQVAAFVMWLPTIANQFMRMLQTGEGRDLNLCGMLEASFYAPVDPDAVPCALNVTALLIVLVVCGMQSTCNALLSLFINRLGRRNTVIAVTAVLGACGIIVNLIPHAIVSAVFFCIFVVGMLSLGLYTAITVAIFPTHLRALAVALTMTGGRIANLASIQILNYLLTTRCELGFYIYASIFALSAVVASFLPDDRFIGAMKPKDEEIQTHND